MTIVDPGVLRAVHVIPSINRADGGPSEVMHNLVPALSRDDVRIAVVSTDKGLTAAELATLPFSPVLGRSHRILRRINFATGLICPLLDAIGDSDVVHVHGVDTYVGTLAMIAAALKGKPVVLEPHGALSAYQARLRSWRKLSYRRLVDRWNYKRVAGLIVSSQMEADEVKAVFADAKTFVVPLGVDDQILEGDAPDRDLRPEVILFLGRITAKKRLDLVLNAVALMPNPLVRLVVAGPIDPALTYDPIALVEQLGISARVDFLGAVDRETRIMLLRKAKAFVLLSDDESFGIAAAEAMAAGCPAVLSRHVGLVTNFGVEAEDGGCGFIVCEQDADQLVVELVRLLEDPKHWRATSSAGRATAVAHFQWAKGAQLMAQAYLQVCSLRGRERK